MLQQKKQISRALAGTGDGGLQEEEAAEQEQQRGMRSRALQLRAMQDQQLEELKLSILADRRVPPLRSDAPPGTRGQLFSAEPADLTWRESRSLSTWQYRAVHTCLHQLGLGRAFLGGCRDRNRLEGERLRREAALDMEAAKAQVASGSLCCTSPLLS